MFRLSLNNSISGRSVFSVYASRKECNEAIAELTNELIGLYKYYHSRIGSTCSASLLKRNQSKMHLSLYDSAHIYSVFCSVDIQVSKLEKNTPLYACHYTASDLAYYLVNFTR